MIRIDQPHLPTAADEPTSRSSGLVGLPGRYYWDPDQFAQDVDRIFMANWLFAAHGSSLPDPGDFVTLQLGRDSIVLIRQPDRSVRGFFNSCRHRGSILCDAPSGRAAKLVCPYHSWVYGLDGGLEQCRLMNEEVDKSQLSLHGVHVESVHEFLFICLAPVAPDFSPAREAFARFIAPHAAQPVKPCLEIDYSIAANWKTVFDNNRECYHCAATHHEFCLSNFDYGMPGDPRSSEEFVAQYDRMQRRWRELGIDPGPVNFPEGQWFRLMRFPLKRGFLSESLDGEPVGPLIGDFADYDIGSLRIVGLPNMWFHLNSDYFMTTRLLPAGPTTTEAKVVWYVRSDAVEGRDYEVARVAEVWRRTSEQDWRLCELNQRGMESTRFVPGPLSQIAEQGVASFAGWYLRQLEVDSSGWRTGAASQQAPAHANGGSSRRHGDIPQTA